MFLECYVRSILVFDFCDPSLVPAKPWTKQKYLEIVYLRMIVQVMWSKVSYRSETELIL